MAIKNFMRALLLPLVAIAASIATPAAQAIPLDYSITYSGSNVGATFDGAFTWDSDTSAFSNFTWNLTPAADTLMAANWRTRIFGGTMGQFLFEILTGEDVHPSACSTVSRCTFTSVNIQSGLLDSVEFRSLGIGLTEYTFRNGSSVLYSGLLSVSRVVLLVSEPLTLLLMGAGLLGLALNRRRAR